MKNTPSTAGIILAAGMSQRMGSPKQLLNVNGKFLLQLVIEAAAHSDLHKIYLVLGHHYERISAKLADQISTPGIEVLYNPQFAQGMSTSVRCGLRLAQRHYDSIMFLVGDQPFITPRIINHLIENYNQSTKQICIPTYKGNRGNPTIFSSLFYEQLLGTTGDIGGRKILQSNPGDILHVAIDDQRALADIDRPEDLQMLGITTTSEEVDGHI